jgi:hypothetical protein
MGSCNLNFYQKSIQAGSPLFTRICQVEVPDDGIRRDRELREAVERIIVRRQVREMAERKKLRGRPKPPGKKKS